MNGLVIIFFGMYVRNLIVVDVLTALLVKQSALVAFSLMYTALSVSANSGMFSGMVISQ
jgi:hypothetical protein